MFKTTRGIKVDVIGLEAISNILNYLGYEYSIKRIENTLDWLVRVYANKKEMCEIKKLGNLNGRFKDHVEFV